MLVDCEVEVTGEGLVQDFKTFGRGVHLRRLPHLGVPPSLSLEGFIVQLIANSLCVLQQLLRWRPGSDSTSPHGGC